MASDALLPAGASRPARLLGDIGGTRARFAWQETDGAPLQDVVSLATEDHHNLTDAVKHYLRTTGRQSAPRWCAIGIANPITGDQVRMTNGDWSFSIAEVQRALGFERFVVINDFTALALALPGLTSTELMQLGGGRAVPGTPLGLIGPGTGLGVSGLVPGAGVGSWYPVQGEGGHVTLAPTNVREAAVLEILRERYAGFKEVVAHEPEGAEPQNGNGNGAPGPQLLQIEGLHKPVFERVATLADLPPGELTAVEADGQSILLANVKGEVYAFKNVCPTDERSRLDGGRLTDSVLVCPWHNCAYDARSGKRSDDRAEDPGLAVVPVATRDGAIQVAVNVT